MIKYIIRMCRCLLLSLSRMFIMMMATFTFYHFVENPPIHIQIFIMVITMFFVLDPIFGLMMKLPIIKNKGKKNEI